MRYKKSQLPPSIKRFIKRKEKYLNRTCRKIWSGGNPKGEIFLFANFCKKYDRVIVTIGHFNPDAVGFFTAPKY